MSGQLVGEVIAASAELRAKGLSMRGFVALMAIAERCRPETRQASVPWSHIKAGLFGASHSTAKRAVADLKTVGVLRVVKRGFDNHNGRVCAPIYEIQPLGERATQVTQSTPSQQVTQVSQSPGGERVKSGGRTGQIDDRMGHSGDLLTVSTNGSLNGARASSGRCTGSGCSICEITRKEIDRCGQCDEYGRLVLDHGQDCPDHGNFRQHQKRRAPA